MDYKLHIVVQKVVVSSQEVVKRDTVQSYAMQRPTSRLLKKPKRMFCPVFTDLPLLLNVLISSSLCPEKC